MKYKKEKVKNFEEYEIDTNGIVYGKKGKPLKYSINHKGYCIINFYINNKRIGFAIHTLVAKQFIDNDAPDIKTQVNHKDGVKTNNKAENLEWVTPSENVKHSIEILHNQIGENNYNAKAIIGIDANTKEKLYEFNSIIDAAHFFKKDNQNARYIQNTICSVLKGRKKKYRGCIWLYK